MHERIEVQSVEQFHDEIQGLVVRDTEVVEFYRVWRSQARSHFGLTPEPRNGELCGRRIARAQHLRANELDRRRTREHAVGGMIDLAHPPTTEERADLIASHLACFRNLLAQPGDDVRDDD